MAKIILVSKKITPTCWYLAQALKSHQHEVVLLTSYAEIPPESTEGLEFLSFFKKWNFFEALQIIPRLLAINPNIVHLLLEEDRLTTAQAIVSAFAKSHPSCVLTTTLFNIKRGLKRRNPVRYLIEESDIITCPTVDALGHIRGLNIRSHQQGRGILPPILKIQGNPSEAEPLSEEYLHMIEKFTKRPYVLMPFSEPEFDPSSSNFTFMKDLSKRYHLLLWGSYAHWPLRDRKKFTHWMTSENRYSSFTVTGLTSPAISHLLMKRAEALFLAGRNLSPAEMTDYYTQAIKTGVPLILDSLQTSLHADLWKNTVNCWMVNHEQISVDLNRLLTRPSLTLQESLQKKIDEDHHVIDSPLNELNRLYNRALNHL